MLGMARCTKNKASNYFASVLCTHLNVLDFLLLHEILDHLDLILAFDLLL